LPEARAERIQRGNPNQSLSGVKEDAKALLADSPWVKHVTPQRLRDLSPDERRNGGNMEAGIGKGVGLAGIGLLGPRREAEALQRAHAKPAPDAVVVRWESAPVRAAELKAGENAPAVDDACYAVVVYGVPLPRRWNLANELKDIAYLKRYRKRDLKPSHVEILRADDGSARSARSSRCMWPPISNRCRLRGRRPP
jgi:hypothetical protein